MEEEIKEQGISFFFSNYFFFLGGGESLWIYIRVIEERVALRGGAFSRIPAVGSEPHPVHHLGVRSWPSDLDRTAWMGGVLGLGAVSSSLGLCRFLAQMV